MTMAERSELMTDADLIDAIQALEKQEPNDEVKELLKMMSENRIITWEEAEQIIGCSTYNSPVKSSLPQQTRPTEPDNDTDVDWSIQQLQLDNPKLKQINLNNMKRTPIPQVKRLLSAIKSNTHLEKIALANMGLYDNDCEPIFDVIASNKTLKSINLETNYLSGDFFARLFKAALVNQTLEEVKAVNQGVTFATAAEKEIIDAVFQNRGLTKVSINLRLPEGRHKIENAMIRNQEISKFFDFTNLENTKFRRKNAENIVKGRILRRQAVAAAREAEEAQKRTEEVNEPVVVKAESRKPQPVKPAILGNASHVPPARKQPPSIVGCAKQTLTDNTDEILPVVIGNVAKNPSTVLSKSSVTLSNEKTKVPTITDSDITNKVSLKAPALAESFSAIELVNVAASRKTELKRPSTKAKPTNSITEATPIKLKSKKLVSRKSLEQAVPEIELNTEEVYRKTSVSKKSSPAAKGSPILSGIAEVAAPASTKSALSRRQNSLISNSTKNNSAVSEITKSTSLIPQSFNEKPATLGRTIRKSSLVPPIFLAADQKNGPVKRNFSIPSKNSPEREKIAEKLGELKRSSLTSNPLNVPMPVYPFKRENASKSFNFN
uniref:Tropomodulin n=1 Tax=Setaria digitata TaxID=48799 RepID=A0A915PS45_9BILA